MCAKLSRRSKLTGPIRARAITALQKTWQAIGYDVMSGFAAEAAGYPTSEPDMEAAASVVLNEVDVRESVSACGFASGYPDMYGDDKQAIEWLEEQSTAVQDAVLAEAFPEGRYGL